MNVIITDQAAKFFNKLNRQIQQKPKKALSKLYDFPEVTNIKRLSGRTKKYRMRAEKKRSSISCMVGMMMNYDVMVMSVFQTVEGEVICPAALLPGIAVCPAEKP